MSFFTHTKKDLADARKELGFAILALADDTSRKMDDENKDRMYILEDLIARLVAVGYEVGADISLFESLQVFRNMKPAYEIEPYEKPKPSNVIPLVSASTIVEVHNTERVNGYPKHKYRVGMMAGCSEPVVSDSSMTGEPVRCGQPREHYVHGIWEMPGNRKPHVFESYSGHACNALYEDADGYGSDCGFPAEHPIHIKEKK